MKALLVLLSLTIIISNPIMGNDKAPKEKKHTFVLVHGAWHGAWSYYKLKYQLEKAGHTAITVNLPGHGLDAANAGNVTLADYQDAIVAILDAVDGPVVLVGHSMGGVAISAAAEARPDKVDKLVYLAAFMPKNGQSMFDLALQDTASLVGPNLIVHPENNTIDIKRENISKIFYDGSSADYVMLSQMLLTANPLQPIVTPVNLTSKNYGSVRRFYISTTYDKAITPEFQRKMIAELPCEEVYYLHSEHSPFFSKDDLLKNILISIADDDKPDPVIDVAQTESAQTKVDDGLKVYQNKNSRMLHVEKENNSMVEKCLVSFVTTDGQPIKEVDMDPNASEFEVPIDGIKEEMVIAIFNLDGIRYNRRILLNK